MGHRYVKASPGFILKTLYVSSFSLLPPRSNRACTLRGGGVLVEIPLQPGGLRGSLRGSVKRAGTGFQQNNRNG